MKNLLQSVVVKRILWTIFFLFVYVLGSRLTLPFVNIDSQNFLGGASAMLAFSTAMMGGNLRSLSLFSVGLSPWMSSMILWQMFSLSKKLGLGNLPIEVQDRRKMILTFVIGLIQALAITLNLPVQDGVPAGLVILMNTLLLIAGSFFLVWLSDINSILGLGGSVVILMAGMMGTMPENIWRSVQTLSISPVWVLLLMLLGVVMLYIAVVVQRARYRIPVNKINIHNRFKKYSYLDIMLNPSGGMPFMYAMSLVAIPQYVLMLVQVLFPSNNWASAGIQAFSMGQPLWIWTYIIVLFILGIAFSFVNLSGEQLAEKMKKSGEYIYDIYPGQATSQYLNRLVLRFAIIGSVYTVLMAGTPMLVVLYDPDYLQLSMIPGLFLIFSGMIFNVKEEIKAITLNETYKPLF